ncbi:helix-turn-helix domain-containing protein [Vibrio sp. 10N.261.51.A7]|uniref:helix-turn-helix domain-containing protein n=1 Tax=Vibrio sp. 10N.261.51.A7 TaxID=1884472 RepID=UPI001054B8FF|nr:helix-turn-helix domain-containing protein [Vibrio sp. 10N.261.51.A7]
MDSLNNTDFKKLASQQKTIQMKMRLLALAHFKDGLSRTQIAKSLKVSRTSVNKWVRIFFEEGLEGLQEKPRTGRPAYLTDEQRAQLKKLNHLLVAALLEAIYMTTSLNTLTSTTTLIPSIISSTTWVFLG